MVVFPNCKINLGLHIVRKRADGYHDLETVFYPLMIRDVIEIVNEPEVGNGKPDVVFSSSGAKIEGEEKNNLCIKTYLLLKKDFPSLPSIKMHLHKNIPVGAGLGGGSADGAFALMLLNKKFNLNLSQQQLIYYALQLGSDCPFFIFNQPCFATSRGENLIPVPLDLSHYKFVIINPAIHVSTARAFAQIVPGVPQKSIQQIIKQPVETWKDELKNDFEIPVMQQYPVIENIKTELYNAGAAYVSMSGSGSTVFGIFNKNIRPKLSFPKNFLQIHL